MAPQLPKLKVNPFQAKILLEGIGTFILVLTIALAETQCGKLAINGTTRTRNLAPLASGFMLTALTFSFAYISGGHFNPATTLGVLLVRGIRIELATSYWIVQACGGMIASVFAILMTSEPRKIPAPQVYNNLPEYVFRGFAMEAFFTAAIVTVVLHVACSKQRNNHYYGLAIGMAYCSASYAVGGVGSGAFNPAVALSLQLAKCFTGNCIPMMHLWLFWGAPAAGAFCASLLYKMTQPAPEEEEAAAANYNALNY